MRIEVLKDGASAIYGADAVAGVVNIITRKKLDGAEFSAYTGTTTHGDGTTVDLAATTGLSGDRGQVLFSAGFSRQGEVMAGSRTFSAIPVIYSATGLPTAFNPEGRRGEIPWGSTIIPGGQITPIPGASGQPNDLYNSLMAQWPDHGVRPKRAACASRDERALCSSVRYRPSGRRPRASSTRACSSVQKNSECRQ